LKLRDRECLCEIFAITDLKVRCCFRDSLGVFGKQPSSCPRTSEDARAYISGSSQYRLMGIEYDLSGAGWRGEVKDCLRAVGEYLAQEDTFSC
jgi:hypothetical protein